MDSGATTEARVAGTGVHMGARIIHPTPATPKKDIDSSTVIRATAIEVGQYK